MSDSRKAPIRISALAFAVLLSACLKSTEPQPSLIQLNGSWNYTGIQTVPVRETLTGTLTIPGRAEPGLYPVRAQLRLTDRAAPAAWRQVVEDVSVVTVGSAPKELVELLYLLAGPADVELRAGDSGRLAVTVGTHARADLALEAHLISPWGTWEWIGPAALGAVLPARGTTELVFDVTPPPWLEPGQWWALIRVGCAGRLVYSPAVKVTVT